ncbi:MAG: DUF4224 domain-containing protein [Paraprevotella sp.]|nr:DUF4224 domain-containing protein [Paraprevotella sp.]
MSALFQLPDNSIMLEEHEIIRLTGSTVAEEQVSWLASRAWIYEKTADGKPIVSRLYFQLRMAGIDATFAQMEDWLQ